MARNSTPRLNYVLLFIGLGVGIFIPVLAVYNSSNKVHERIHVRLWMFVVAALLSAILTYMYARSMRAYRR